MVEGRLPEARPDERIDTLIQQVVTLSRATEEIRAEIEKQKEVDNRLEVEKLRLRHEVAKQEAENRKQEAESRLEVEKLRLRQEAEVEKLRKRQEEAENRLEVEKLRVRQEITKQEAENRLEIEKLRLRQEAESKLEVQKHMLGQMAEAERMRRDVEKRLNSYGVPEVSFGSAWTLVDDVEQRGKMDAENVTEGTVRQKQVETESWRWKPKGRALTSAQAF